MSFPMQIVKFINETPGIWAFFAAVFAGLAAYAALSTKRYALKRDLKDDAPDLFLEKDRFVYGNYEFADLSAVGVPKNIPPMTISIKPFVLINNKTKKRLNRMCIVCNSSRKNTANEKPDNYSGIFGELHFVNRGALIKRIEITQCCFIMRDNPALSLEKKFSLAPDGVLDVNVERGSAFILYISYLYDDDSYRLCNPKYITDGKLNQGQIEAKRNEENQLRCNLPVIIDLYDQFIFTFKYLTQRDDEYKQTFIIKIKMDNYEDEESGGVYNPILGPAICLRYMNRTPYNYQVILNKIKQMIS